MTNMDLINMAVEARKNAMTPTKYYCGAAILAANGKVYTGCNLGSEDGIFNICAERVAVCKMLSDGVKSFEKIAVVGGPEDKLIYTTPCGVCRQLIHTFGADIDVVMGYPDENGEMKEAVLKAKELLPGGFVM